MSVDLVITKRESCGTRASKKMRHDNCIPGVIYGKDCEPILVQVDKKNITQFCKTTSFIGQIFDVNIDGKKFKVISRDIQYNVVTDEPIHADFQKISKDTTVKVAIPVEFINEDKSPGIKRGGVLNVVLYKVDCMCKVDSIPEKLHIDMTGREIGDSCHIDMIKLPNGVTFAYKDKNVVVATIVMSKAVVNTEATAA